MQIPVVAKRLCALIGAAAIAGCAATESKLAVPYEVTVIAAQDVNPDSTGRPSPIQVTVYELTSQGAFQSSDYFSLMDDARKALGEDVSDLHRLTLRPGEQKTVQRPGAIGARALGIVASYRDLDAGQWRIGVELPESRSTNIYKFWQFSPGSARIVVKAGRQGLALVSQED